jgi:hypothetical protein
MGCYKKLTTVLSACVLLTGCGTTIPSLTEFWGGPDDSKRMVNAIVHQVRCELKQSFQDLAISQEVFLEKLKRYNAKHHTNIKMGETLEAWLFNKNTPWAAQFTLNLQIEEKTSINPGVSSNIPMASAITAFPGEAGTNTVPPPKTFTPITATTPQLFSLGIGGTLSSDALRIEKLTFIYPVNDLLNNDIEYRPCDPNRPVRYPNSTPFIVQSDLKLSEWLQAAVFPTFTREGIYGSPSNDADLALTDGTVQNFEESDEFFEETIGAAANQSANANNSSVISHEIKFEIVTSGNITPTWKLVRVSANTGSSNLFNASRDRTNDLTITLAPAQKAAITCDKGYTFNKEKQACCSDAGVKACLTTASSIQLSTAGLNSALASEIGLAVANSIHVLP